MKLATKQNHSQLAFLVSIPIAVLGGLMGLGGAEFRLPILAGPLGYSARQVVPLNLAISLITILISLLVRGKILSLSTVLPYSQIIIFLVLGAMLMAFLGATWSKHLSNERLEKIILVFLIIIGCTLIIEGLLPEKLPALVPPLPGLQIIVALSCGSIIGLVSSLLGVAGGELIIPTLIFAFGVDIKIAGTSSLIISLPTVLVGLIKYYHQGSFVNPQPLKKTVLPMGLGSLIGAIIGGLLVGVIPSSMLKIILGIILNIAALKVFLHSQA
ncbi:MAG: sulfite exporter TauE/SafE family protein [Crocosphaera sp.]|nr:sulfite exporter TauE/SafE family protein [Crocosphaera sp.]